MCRFEHQLKNLVLCLHSVSNELPSSEFQKGPKLEQLTMIPKLGNRPYSRARPRFIGLLRRWGRLHRVAAVGRHYIVAAVDSR